MTTNAIILGVVALLLSGIYYQRQWIWEQIEEPVMGVWSVLKWVLGAYLVVSVGFMTLTLFGKTEVIPLYTPTAEADYRTQELGEMDYQQWRNARAEHMMESESWREHMLDEAKDAVDKYANVESETDLQKKRKEFNMMLYGQETVPTTTPDKSY